MSGPDLVIVSPDDHVVEPPDLWSSRLPRKYADIGPRVVILPEAVRDPGHLGKQAERPSTDGKPSSWWRYEDQLWMLRRLHAFAGFDDLHRGVEGTTFEEIRRGCWDPAARLADMDANGVAASLCFPSYIRFAGQMFLAAEDRVLALLCVQAYNDWMVDEWAGPSGDRLIPLCIVPLWDAQLAAAEIRRNAARGVRAAAFSELPPWLGLPSIHSGYWDPFFAACEETGTVVCMHIGSGTRIIQSSDDAPPSMQGTLIFVNTCTGMLDYLSSTVLLRYPGLRLFFAEGQIGWIPYVLDRADDVWRTHGWAAGAERTPPPSELYRDRIFSCFFKDSIGVRLLDAVGEDQVMFETDYPHADGTWPNSRTVASDLLGGVPERTVAKVVHGNAIRLFGLDAERLGIRG